MSEQIIKGSDKKFIVKLRIGGNGPNAGDPLPLKGLTKSIVRFKKQIGGYLEIDSNPIPAKAADGTITVTANAALAGSTVTADGNALVEGVDWTLTVGNNIATATSLAAAINALPTVVSSSDGNIVNISAATAGSAGNNIQILTSNSTYLTVSEAALNGGYDQYQKVSLYDEFGEGTAIAEYLGKLQVILNDVDTSQLRVEDRQTIEVIVDLNGVHPSSDRETIHIPNAVSVKDSPIA